MILGVDVGGTFTDLVLVSDRSVTTAKVPTSQLQSDGVATGARQLLEGACATRLLHGTTVATNTLLERTGGRTLLITDDGFEDVLEIGRQDRPSLYDSFDDRPAPLVTRQDRITTDDIAPGRFEGVDAVAVAHLNAHSDASIEHTTADAVRASGFGGPVSLSSDVSPEFREFERTSTTVLNAYLTPGVATYLDVLRDAIVNGGISESIAVMQSSGGLASVEHASGFPASILLSGPAGGAIATAAFAQAHGHERVISFDMGGTSTDVCRIEAGAFDVSYERSIEGFPCRLPSAAIHTVGAGGGSIAWIDAGGSLRVGPRSAGAHPGPACYGNGGTEPTVTDAHAVLGRLDPDVELGDTISVDVGAAIDAVRAIADQLNLSVEAAALGIITIAETTMARAVRTVSVEQGADPRGAYLYAFGGAGGLHASSLARSLGMSGAVIPPHGGVFSALGLLLARPRVDRALSTLGRAVSSERLAEIATDSRHGAVEALRASGAIPTAVDHHADVRYLGQAHEITVPFEPGDSIELVAERFHAAHAERNGYTRADDPIEIVAVRTVALADASLSIGAFGSQPAPTRGPARSSEANFGHGPLRTARVSRGSLEPGTVVEGPAIIEESEATTIIHPGDTARVLDTGAIEVTW